ncbi:MAG: restriction endonuclease [Promicromonosporaceae bacterium]|nr:restriction endonuclease [Promicromonosporaceae bacterium]
MEISGVPRDVAGARALFESDHFDFERWAVSLLDARPNDKRGSDRGADGVGRFLLPTSKSRFGRVLVSVKGGSSLNPGMVRDLVGTVETENAELGVLITLREPTKGMVDAANKTGAWIHPANGQTYPRMQIITVSEMLAGKKPHLPPIVLPYVKAQRQHESARQALSVQGELV